MSVIVTKVEQITPNWITNILQSGGTIPKNISVTDIHLDRSEMANCVAYYLTLKYNHVNHASAPHRLFLKLPNPDFERADKEVEFYTVIVPVMQNSPMRQWPFLRCYHAACSAETGQAHFLFEDLSVTHFTTDDSMPPTQGHCEQVIDAYARFHAFWWEHPKLGQEIGQLLTDEMIDGFIGAVQKRFSQLVDDMGAELAQADQEILERVALAWPSRRRDRVIQGKGVTLVHRDPHPRNFLYPKQEQDGIVKLIDWQSWRIDTGTDDLAYLMAFHWPFEARVQMELDLVKRYHHQLVGYGVTGYTWDDCCYDYKASVIRCLFFLMGAWSLKQWERIKKGIEAFKHWECAELLAN